MSSQLKQRKKASTVDTEDSDVGLITETEVEEEENEKPKKQEPPAPAKTSTSLEKVIIRTITACVMTTFFLVMLQAGHFYCLLVGIITQTELYRELVNVRYVEAKERAMPLFRTLQWLMFGVAMMSIYGESFHKFCAERRNLFYLATLSQDLNIITYVSYCIVFMLTVLTFRSGLLRFQISQFMWSIVTICLIVFQSKFFATNTVNGLFWFFFPTSTVVMNDVSAYFVGISFGRKFIQAPLSSLSPNKTWEGFIGAFVLTVIFSFFYPWLLAQWSWFTCPAEELTLSPFPPALHCTPHPIFTNYFPVQLPLVGELHFLPIQVHGLYYGLFASLVAPFGGFFASAIKRAYKKKDFDSFVPGHGGMMDRMDCQLLMFTFTYYHYTNFVNPTPSLDKLEYMASLLSQKDKLQLLAMLGEMVKNNATAAVNYHSN